MRDRQTDRDRETGRERDRMDQSPMEGHRKGKEGDQCSVQDKCQGIVVKEEVMMPSEVWKVNRSSLSRGGTGMPGMRTA